MIKVVSGSDKGTPSSAFTYSSTAMNKSTLRAKQANRIADRPANYTKTGVGHSGQNFDHFDIHWLWCELTSLIIFRAWRDSSLEQKTWWAAGIVSAFVYSPSAHRSAALYGTLFRAFILVCSVCGESKNRFCERFGGVGKPGSLSWSH